MPAGNFQSDHFAAEVRTGINQRARNFAVVENALLAVNVLQEKIQRHHALGKPAVNLFPFGMGQDPRNQVERKQPFGILSIAVDCESDALNQERKIGEFPALLELRGRYSDKFLEELGILRPRLARRDEHLVVEIVGLVPFKQARTHYRR